VSWNRPEIGLQLSDKLRLECFCADRIRQQTTSVPDEHPVWHVNCDRDINCCCFIPVPIAENLNLSVPQCPGATSMRRSINKWALGITPSFLDPDSSAPARLVSSRCVWVTTRSKDRVQSLLAFGLFYSRSMATARTLMHDSITKQRNTERTSADRSTAAQD